MGISRHFIIQELVPHEIYNQFLDHSWQFIDPRLVTLIDFIREYFNKPITINNWHSGGSLSLRGFRPPDTVIGGKLSQHKFGRATDFNVVDMLPRDVYKRILDNPQPFMDAGLTTMEDISFTTTWCHCDIRYTGLTSILIVKP